MNLNQGELVKYGIIGIAGLAALGFLNSLSESAAPMPAPKAVARGGGSGNLDFAGSYYGEDDEDDDYYAYAAPLTLPSHANARAKANFLSRPSLTNAAYAYEGEDEDDYDYYGYAGETGTPGGMHPGDGHPGPGGPPHPPPTGGGPPPGHGFPGGHPGPITPHTPGHQGGWRGFQLGNRFFDFRRYHITNPMWRWFQQHPFHGFFPATHQLGFPYGPHSYPNMSNPFLCYKFPWSMMPQCRNRRRPFPGRGRPFQPGWRPGMPGHPGLPGHPGFPGHPGNGNPGTPGHNWPPGPGH